MELALLKTLDFAEETAIDAHQDGWYVLMPVTASTTLQFFIDLRLVIR